MESSTPRSPANGPLVSAAATRDLPVYDSSRPRLPIVQDAIELVRYRDLIWSLVQRDLTARYKRSVLGFIWTMLNPLLMMVVQSIVFSTIFRFAIEHYPVYILSGILLWNFFSQSTLQGIHNIVWGGEFFDRIYVPKAAFVVSAVLVGLVNLTLALIPLIFIMLITGSGFSWALLFLPVPFFLTLLFSLGIGLLVSTLAVFFVDVIDIYQVGLTIVMYLTPIFYPAAIVPEKYLVFLHLNPMYYFVQIFRAPIFDGQLPEWSALARAAILAVGALVAGWWLFTAKSDEFAYRM